MNWFTEMGLQGTTPSLVEDTTVVRKVLVIAGHFPPMKSGEATHAFHLSKQLQQRGYEIDVLTSRGAINGNGHGIRVHPVMRNWSWKESPILMKFIRRCSPDVILLMYIGLIYNEHAMVTYAPTLSKLVLPAAAFVTLLEYPIGADSSKTIISRIVRKTAARLAGPQNVDYCYGTLLRDSNRIITLSDSHRVTLAKDYPGVNSKAVVIPPPPLLPMLPDENGAVRYEARGLLGVKSDEILIAYFGYIYVGKGVETLLKAFQKVSAYHKTVRLILIGGVQYLSGSFLETIYRLPKELGIEEKVIWTGEYASDSDKPSRFLHAADICVLPFDKGVDLNNSSFAAAAAHGLPIITTHSAGVESIFLHNENVFLCPPKKPDALAAAIETLIANPVLRKRLGSGARDLAQEWFSWEKAIERITKTLNAARRDNGCTTAQTKESSTSIF